MKLFKHLFSLFVFIFFIGGNFGTLYGQAVALNNSGAPTGGTCTNATTVFNLNNFAINAGNNRMVVILAGPSGTPPCCFRKYI